MITNDEISELEALIDAEEVDNSKTSLLDFTKYTLEGFDPSEFHKKYYEILQMFADGKIKKLIISVPPQHGKSEGSSKRLPAFLFGLHPKLNIALASYNTTFAKKFNRQVQRIIDSPEYHRIFPDTTLNESNVVASSGSWLRNTEEFEIVKHGGSFKAVGVGGGLTGNKVDIMLMDDLYKDYQDATSSVVSEGVWDWYKTVVKTRLHNKSQELIVFTRWDDNDLVGRLEKMKKVVDYDGNKETIDNLDQSQFLRINFEAIKTTLPNDVDTREIGEPLWPSVHSLEKLNEVRELDTSKFSALYQGQPKTKEGLMYSPFGEYDTLPTLKKVKSYTDTADTGKDNLCSVVYGVPLDKEDVNIYLIDVLFTPEGMEITEPKTAEMLIRNDSRVNMVESNNGGKGFARSLGKLVTKRNIIKWFHQSENKFARIFSNSASVNRQLKMPKRWDLLYPEFYDAITDYKKDGTTKHDDAPDTITGVWEQEFEAPKKNYIY